MFSHAIFFISYRPRTPVDVDKPFSFFFFTYGSGSLPPSPSSSSSSSSPPRPSYAPHQVHDGGNHHSKRRHLPLHLPLPHPHRLRRHDHRTARPREKKSRAPPLAGLRSIERPLGQESRGWRGQWSPWVWGATDRSGRGRRTGSRRGGCGRCDTSRIRARWDEGRAPGGDFRRKGGSGGPKEGPQLRTETMSEGGEGNETTLRTSEPGQRGQQRTGALL